MFTVTTNMIRGVVIICVMVSCSFIPLTRTVNKIPSKYHSSFLNICRANIYRLTEGEQRHNLFDKLGRRVCGSNQSHFLMVKACPFIKENHTLWAYVCNRKCYKVWQWASIIVNFPDRSAMVRRFCKHIWPCPLMLSPCNPKGTYVKYRATLKFYLKGTFLEFT